MVLISQNKQALQADKRAKIELQVNMIAERETTKILTMVAAIQQHLGIALGSDTEIARLQTIIDIHQIADELDLAKEKSLGAAAKGPESAADTSH